MECDNSSFTVLETLKSRFFEQDESCKRWQARNESNQNFLDIYLRKFNQFT